MPWKQITPLVFREGRSKGGREGKRRREKGKERGNGEEWEGGREREREWGGGGRDGVMDHRNAHTLTLALTNFQCASTV